MKILNLLKPDVRTGYLNGGKGQEVTYLQIPHNVSCRELKEDIDNGAAFYRELAEFAGKKPSQFVIIKCKHEEEGLAAMTYLAAIYNEIEDVDTDEDEEDMEIAEEMNRDFYSDTENVRFDDDEEEWQEACDWIETPWRIPLIKDTELDQCDSGFPVDVFGVTNYSGLARSPGQLPYWYDTRTENICIIHNPGKNFFANNSNLSQKLKRFKGNRHVFLLIVENRNLPDMTEENLFGVNDRQWLWDVILEYSAGIMEVSCDEDSRKEYYELLFENWIYKKGYELEDGFPIKKITHQILKIDNEDKSALMEKVINYTIKDKMEEITLREQDFNILKALHVCEDSEEGKEKKGIRRMDSELVGMEDVKEQIRGIVEVMKYNKRRYDMGLGKGNYHNVHMMLGAPGTAKTTMAELIGDIMVEERLLPNNRFISVNGAELKGMYVGHSAPKVKALFDEYDIIFIDEAYAIASQDSEGMDSFSQEAIAQLIVELEKHGMDRLVMFAGYGGEGVSERDNKMKKFLQSNPGIRSRINSTIYFKSYTAEEMVKIFRLQAKNNKLRIPRNADAAVLKFFEARVKQPDFGNGREARSLLENSIVETAKRLGRLPEENVTAKMMTELKLADIKKAIARMENNSRIQAGAVKSVIGF